MIARDLPNFIKIVCWETISCSLLRRLMIIFSNFQNSIRAHVGLKAFATLEIELYRIVDYDRKWSIKFHKY